MRKGRIGRVIVASLHQAIADITPSRLEFYESWLNSEGLRNGTIGLAAMVGVIGFLRGEQAYELITVRAGEYAGTWTAADLPRATRLMLRLLPRFLRTRWALRLARQMIRAAYPGTRTALRIRGGTAVIDIRGSLFCDSRATTASPLCTFYRSAVSRLLASLDVPADAEISACRAVGARVCALSIVVGARAHPSEQSMAA
jgi:hypothetical protein